MSDSGTTGRARRRRAGALWTDAEGSGMVASSGPCPSGRLWPEPCMFLGVPPAIGGPLFNSLIRKASRRASRRMAKQATRILNDLRMIDSAVDQYAIETAKSSGSTVNVTDWTNYVKKDTLLYASGQNLFGDAYGPQTVDQLPKCPANSWNTLSDVADTSFFSPYGHF